MICKSSSSASSFLSPIHNVFISKQNIHRHACYIYVTSIIKCSIKDNFMYLFTYIISYSSFKKYDWKMKMRVVGMNDLFVEHVSLTQCLSEGSLRFKIVAV